MIEHRGCDKQVRDRVSAEPSLIGHSHSVRGAIHCLIYDFTNARIFRIRPFANFPLTCVYCGSAMFLWEEKRRRLTYVPPVNAAAASTVENYEASNKIIRRQGTDGENYQTDNYA